jgi:hypothetical protein
LWLYGTPTLYMQLLPHQWAPCVPALPRSQLLCERFRE